MPLDGAHFTRADSSLRLVAVTFPTAPKTTVTAKGEIISEEVSRAGVSRLEKYVAEMAAGSKISVPSVNVSTSLSMLSPEHR